MYGCSSSAIFINFLVQSPASLVILDNIERLVEYVPIGPRFSNSLLQIILELLEKQPPKGKKLMVIGTSSDAAVMSHLGVVKAFTMAVNVPLLTEAEIRQVFVEVHAFKPHEVRLGLFTPPRLQASGSATNSGSRLRVVQPKHYYSLSKLDDLEMNLTVG